MLDRRRTQKRRQGSTRRVSAGRPYKTVYPKRLLHPVRIARLLARGVLVCPRCGSEAVHRGKDGCHAVCLRCGYGWK